MMQQINLYQSQFRPQTRMFPARIMLQGAAVLLFAMVLMFVFAQSRVGSIERELEIMVQQESAALARLQVIGPLIEAETGKVSWAAQLDESLRLLAERQAVLELIQGSAFGETQGFSRHMRALARQDVDGIWLTRIVLAGDSDKTRLEGRALRAELIPLYVQELTTEAPFAEQRFQRFQIDSPEDETETAVYFSMDSEMLLTADTRN